MSIQRRFAVWAVGLGYALLALTGIRTLSHPGIFTHIALAQRPGGFSYTVNEAAWTELTPLYNQLVSALWSLGGAGLITLVHVLVVIAAFILLDRFARDWGGPLSRAIALLLCARLMLPVFHAGPWVFFALFTALSVTLLYSTRSIALRAAGLLAIQLLWTNLHPSFLFGPLLILFYAIENRQLSSSRSKVQVINPETVPMLGIALAALVLTLANPSTINLHLHLARNWSVLTGSDNMHWISLYNGFFQQQWIGRLTLFSLVLGACGLVTLQKSLPPMITFLALCGAFLTVRSVGMLHLFTFLAYPFLTLSLDAVGEQIGRTAGPHIKLRPPILYGSMTVVAVLLLLASFGSLITNCAYARMGSASEFGLGLQKDAFPYAAEGILMRDDFPERAMHIAHDGGYLAARIPNRKVFCDSRISFYGPEFYTTLNQALLGQADAFRSILAEWNPHAVVLNAGWPDSGALANRLIAARTWKLVYFDGSTVILVRDLPEYASLINDASIQQYGLHVLDQSRRDYLRRNGRVFKAGNPSRLIGAGGMYLALNRPAEAEAVYRILTRGNPRMAGAWLGLGKSMILQRRLSRGIDYMERAARITPQSARIWISLLDAYRLRGDEEKAMNAIEKLNRFFREERATVEQQESAERPRRPERPQPQQDAPEIPRELK